MTERGDANRVAGRLWQGSFPAGRWLREAFDAVVFCAEELQPPPERYPGLTRLYLPLHDDGTPLQPTQVHRTLHVAKKVRRLVDQGKRVLVTCHMGLNRSGLVSAVVLMLPRSTYATDPRTPACCSTFEAITLVRAARGRHALGNPAFERMLVGLQGRLCRTRTAFHPNYGRPSSRA